MTERQDVRQIVNLLKLREFIILQIIHFKVKWVNLVEYIKVLYNYYSNLNFRQSDTALLFAYLLKNPFRISKRFLLSRGAEEIYTYGETPLTTLDHIAKECRLNSEDTVFELGCGRARTCFWLNAFIGCKVVGIDFVPEFIAIANKIVERYHLQGLTFRLEDIFEADFTGATVIYLYGICYTDVEIGRLVKGLDKLPKGTKIITVSYAITDIIPKAPYRIERKFSAAFTWGITDVYLQLATR